MKIKTQEIREGGRIGDVLWICDYRQPDLAQKPIRHVKPTEVMVVDNSELPANKTVYYSETHFRPLSKKREPLKKIISPVDNTGFRHRSGFEIAVFDDENQCRQHYQSQCDEIISRLYKNQLTAVENIQAEINKIKAFKKKG